MAWKAVEQELAGLNKADDDESDGGGTVTAREAERVMQNAANGLGSTTAATQTGNKWNIDTQGILAEQKWYQTAGCTALSPPHNLSTGASAGAAVPLSTPSSDSEHDSPVIPIVAPARIVSEINGSCPLTNICSHQMTHAFLLHRQPVASSKKASIHVQCFLFSHDSGDPAAEPIEPV